MRGCLSLPFRLAFLAVLVLGGYFAWSYRDDIRRKIHEWTRDDSPPQAVGLGNPARAPAVRRRIASLGSARVDSVVLSAADVASLVAASAEARVPGALDSLVTRFERDEVRLQARVDTRRLPVSLGPLGGVLRDRESLDAGGVLSFRHRGLAEWRLTRVRVRGVPLPAEVIGRLLQRYGAGDGSVVPLPLPLSVGGLRVSPAGLVLYGTGGPS